MKTLITIIALISISPVFADTLEKVDANTVKITTTQEKTYTYEDIQSRINSLKSERDGQQNNLNLLDGSIAEWEKLLKDAEATGIKAKVEATEENIKGE